MKTYKDLDKSLTPEQRAEVEATMSELKRNTPECLRNLVWESGEMYYVDDSGKRIEKQVDLQEVTEAMVSNMPASPALKLNGKEVDRKSLLRGFASNARWRCESCLKLSTGLGPCEHCGSNAC